MLKITDVLFLCLDLEMDYSYWTRRRRIKKRVKDRIRSNNDHEINFTEEVCDSPSPILEYTETIESCKHILSSDSESIYSSNEPNTPDSLTAKLATWAVENKISLKALSSLLEILRLEGHLLPKDSRTLLATPTNYKIDTLGSGRMHYFSVKKQLTRIFMDVSKTCVLPDRLTLQVNIDGLPLFKSSGKQFWPILGKMTEFGEVFIIHLFCGEQKPNNVDAFLSDFVVEMQDVLCNGVHISSKHVTVTLSCFICDTPARAFVKKVKGHTGYAGCDKCTQNGLYVKNRMTFPEINAPARTDECFASFADENHHVSAAPSILCSLPIGMVSQFPIDSMHAVYLGVMKKIILLWMRGPIANRCRQSSFTLSRISEMIIQFSHHLPKCFVRRGRTLTDVDRWKASEFRLFLLYTGPVILKNLIDSHMYKNFLLLFVGIHCLTNHSLHVSHCHYAHSILKLFVTQFGNIYGEEMLTYNVHSLVHLSGDVQRFGPLDSFSCFPFESFLGKMKKLIRSPNRPLEQMIRRCEEKQMISTHEPLPSRKVRISVETNDNCYMTSDSVILVKEIIGENSFSAQKFKCKDNLFTYPTNSSNLHIYCVSNLSNKLFVYSLSSIICKCVILPHEKCHVVIPLSHGDD